MTEESGEIGGAAANCIVQFSVVYGAPQGISFLNASNFASVGGPFIHLSPVGEWGRKVRRLEDALVKMKSTR